MRLGVSSTAKQTELANTGHVPLRFALAQRCSCQPLNRSLPYSFVALCSSNHSTTFQSIAFLNCLIVCTNRTFPLHRYLFGDVLYCDSVCLAFLPSIVCNLRMNHSAIDFFHVLPVISSDCIGQLLSIVSLAVLCSADVLVNRS